MGPVFYTIYHNPILGSLKCCIFFALLHIGFFNNKHTARRLDKTFACQRWFQVEPGLGAGVFRSGSGLYGRGLRRGPKTQSVCLGNLSRLSVSACCSCCALVRRFGVRVAFHVYINKSQRFSRLTYCNLCLVTALYRRKTNFNHLLFSINELPPLDDDLRMSGIDLLLWDRVTHLNMQSLSSVMTASRIAYGIRLRTT